MCGTHFPNYFTRFILSGSLPTIGGADIDLFGINLGVDSEVLQLQYSGGSTDHSNRSYNATDCIVVVAETHVRCTSVPGIGANYSFVLCIAGGCSDRSDKQLSYTAPIVDSVDGPGAVLASTAGGSFIFLHGSNFGPQEESPDLTVWAAPVQDQARLFYAAGCRVYVDHVTLVCNTTEAIGSPLSWRVMVEGQVICWFPGAGLLPLCVPASSSLQAKFQRACACVCACACACCAVELHPNDDHCTADYQFGGIC